MKNVRILVLSVLCVLSCGVRAQDYLDWDYYFVTDIFVRYEPKRRTVDKDGERVWYLYEAVDGFESGVYDIELGAKEMMIYGKDLYNVRGTETYLEFSYDPFLQIFDEGVLVWNGGSGVFYVKP